MAGFGFNLVLSWSGLAVDRLDGREGSPLVIRGVGGVPLKAEGLFPPLAGGAPKARGWVLGRRLARAI